MNLSHQCLLHCWGDKINGSLDSLSGSCRRGLSFDHKQSSIWMLDWTMAAPTCGSTSKDQCLNPVNSKPFLSLSELPISTSAAKNTGSLLCKPLHRAPHWCLNKPPTSTIHYDPSQKKEKKSDLVLLIQKTAPSTWPNSSPYAHVLLFTH